MIKKVGLIPRADGSNGPKGNGTEQGPLFMYYHGIVEKIQELGKEVCTFQTETDAISHGYFPLVLGGDHSVVYNNVRTSLDRYDHLGIIWIDAHADLNYEKSSLTGNKHGMILNTIFSQNEVRGHDNLCLIGVRDLDGFEEQLIDDFDIPVYRSEYVNVFGCYNTAQDVVKKLMIDGRVDCVHISVDIDVLDPSGYTGVSVPAHGGNLWATDIANIIYEIKRLIPVVSADVVELDPTKDDDKYTTTKAAILIAKSIIY